MAPLRGLLRTNIYICSLVSRDVNEVRRCLVDDGLKAYALCDLVRNDGGFRWISLQCSEQAPISSAHVLLTMASCSPPFPYPRDAATPLRSTWASTCRAKQGVKANYSWYQLCPKAKLPRSNLLREIDEVGQVEMGSRGGCRGADSV